MQKLKQHTPLFIFLLFVVANGATGQRTIINATKADSLLIVSKQNALDSKDLNQLSRFYFSHNPDSAFLFAKKALEQAQISDDISEMGYAYKNLGNYHYHLSNYDSALHYYTLAEKQFRKINHTEGLVALYNNIGVIHKSLNQPGLALKYFQKVRSLMDKTKVDKSAQAVLYSNLAGLYYISNQTDEGVAYLDSAFQMIEKLDDTYLKGVIYNNLGKFFSDIGRYDKALSMLKLSEQNLSPEVHTRMFSLNLLNFGEIYEAIYNYNRAEEYFNQALELQSSQGDSAGVANTLLQLAGINITRKQYEKAHHQLSNALRLFEFANRQNGIAKTLVANAEALYAEEKYQKAIDLLNRHEQEVLKADHLPILTAYYDIRLKAFDRMNFHKEALEASKIYFRLNDSINKSRNEANNSVLRQELKRSKQLMIDELAEQQEASNQKVQKTRFWLYASLAIVLLALAGFITYRRQSAKKLARYKARIDEKEAAIAELQNEAREFDKEVEEKLQEKTAEYEQQIKEFKKKDNKLKRTLKEVEDANYLKNAFLSNMSHEIRTPLNGIIGFASLLETELSLLENEELFGYANGIQQSGERLLHLLNNIIDISRIEANDLQVSLQDTNVNQIVEKSSELFRFQANEKNLSFNIKLVDTPMAYADPDSVSKILSDIIDNAVKYTEKGFINITNGYDGNKKEVFVKVRDTGIGIDENYLPKLFEAFRQESLGYSRAFQGAGLGLPLAKRLLDLLNGRIDVESKKKVGTTVTVFLPTKETFKHVGESFKTKGKDAIELKKPLDKTKIFLVEDDRMNRLVITKMLSGWNLVSAEDGDITIEKIEKAYRDGVVYDLMLFDINLPNPWDGIKLMHHIKKKFPEYEKIPFIAQTAYAMRGDKERLLEEGFDDYLSKPISQQRLLTAMYKFLSKEKEG